MISGIVDQRGLAIIPLRVLDTDGLEHQIEALVDTGYNASLTLPPALITRFGLPWRTRGEAVLADGNEEEFDIHAATVIWDGIARNILVDAADMEPLVGTKLLRGHDLRIRFVDGGSVEIEAIP